MKKTYVLDTNVLLSDSNSIFSFEEHNVIIPLNVLEELDHHKNRPDEIGRHVRQVSRSLDNMRQNGGSLMKGVKLENGGTLSVVLIEPKHVNAMPIGFDAAEVDNLILAYMLWLTKETENKKTKQPAPILVTRDINVRIKSDSLAIVCEDYKKLRVTDSTQKFYSGVDVIEISDDLIDHLYLSKILPADDLPKGLITYPNQIVVVKGSNVIQTRKSAITRFKQSANGLVLVQDTKDVYGLRPRNKEQNFSLDLLLDPSIKLLTLVGPSGTGKTLLALAAGLAQLETGDNEGLYERIIVTRPVQPLGKDIGFLPGTLDEKMEPWIAPIRDNLNFLMGNRVGRSQTRPRTRKNSGKGPSVSNNDYLSIMQEKGLIEIEAITFIRGRSIPNSFIVIDEAQNLSMHELKTIITRVGDGTKIVLTGDIEQIDNNHVDAYTNGLTYAVERFKEHDIAAHVTLIKGERSPLATLASKIL